MAGHLSQYYTFPTSTKDWAPPPLSDRNDIFNDDGPRFRERAKRPAVKEAHRVWIEILEQRDLGWVDGPFALTENGRFPIDPESLINLAFRFHVIQPGGVKACDDCMRSTLNDFVL